MNTDKIVEISNKVRKKIGSGLNEEQTKNSFILPLFMALGYDIFDVDEFVPEYTADFGTKRGEKVDYAICIKGQPMILIEAKKLDTQLATEHVSQLFRYYSSTDAKIGILTNGDDYWFFTDSIKKNQMDTEPYIKIKMSNFDDKTQQTLEYYCRDNIEKIDICEDVQVQRFRVKSSDFISKLQSGNIPSDFIDYLALKSDISDIDRLKLAAIFNEEYKRLQGSSKQSIETVTRMRPNDGVTENLGTKKRGSWDRTKISDIPIGTPLVYTQYNWTFHKPCEFIINRHRYDVSSFKDIALYGLSYIFTEGEIDSDLLISKLDASPNKFTVYREYDNNIRAIAKIPETEFYISTALSANGVIQLVKKAADIAGIKDSDINIIISE